MEFARRSAVMLERNEAYLSVHAHTHIHPCTVLCDVGDVDDDSDGVCTNMARTCECGA